jgi:penicillin amidase
MMILDGTRHGAFEIPSDGEGRIREDGACVVPFSAGPRAITPDAGYVLTANHDPIGNTFDGALSGDQFYIGGTYDLGYRANTIDTRLGELASAGGASVEAMSELQGDHRAPLALEYVPVLLATMEAAKTSMGPERAIYDRLGGRGIEIASRLDAWLARGAISESGVETFYEQPSEDQKRDAVATMIYAAWLRALVDAIFADEDIDFAFGVSRAERTFRVLHNIVAGRGANNPRALSSWNPATEESAFFDVLGTDPIEESPEIILGALETAIGRLESTDGFGNSDMNTWLWGMKHQVRFKALLEEVAAGNPIAGILAFKFAINTATLPLGENIPSSDPRSKLENFPRAGDFYTVDVGAGGFSGPYFYSHGPVMRMVISLDGEQISGRNILPGGQSGLAGDEHFADQAKMWLGNETVPIRYHAADVKAGASGTEKLLPEK